MRRVGNNWRITLCMRYKKKARGDVLEFMVLHGIVNLVVSLIYHLKDAKRGPGFTAENETVSELYQKFNAANLIYSLLRQYASKRTHRRGVTEQSRT